MFALVLSWRWICTGLTISLAKFLSVCPQRYLHGLFTLTMHLTAHECCVSLAAIKRRLKRQVSLYKQTNMFITISTKPAKQEIDCFGQSERIYILAVTRMGLLRMFFDVVWPGVLFKLRKLRWFRVWHRAIVSAITLHSSDFEWESNCILIEKETFIVYGSVAQCKTCTVEFRQVDRSHSAIALRAVSPVA